LQLELPLPNKGLLPISTVRGFNPSAAEENATPDVPQGEAEGLSCYPARRITPRKKAFSTNR